MKHTLVDYVENETKARRLRAAAGGGNKNTVQPQMPGKQGGQTPQQLAVQPNGGPQQPPQPPGAPGTMPQMPPMPGQPLANMPMMQPVPPAPHPMPAVQPQQVGPYATAPKAQVMPGQNTPPQPGVPRYPNVPVKGKAAAAGKGKGKQDPNAQDPNADPSQDPTQRNSPAGAAAQHVATHVQDPLGATHTMFQNLGQKKLEYEMEKENARRTIAPVQAVLQHVDTMHQLTQPIPMSPDEQMGWQDPNNPQQPGAQTPVGGGTGPGGPPSNMAGQRPGAPGMGTPQGASQAPGASPAIPGNANSNGPAKGKVPPKMGTAKPGGGVDPGKPGANKNNGKPGGGKKISMTVEGRSADMGVRPMARHSLQSAVAMSDMGCFAPKLSPSPARSGGGGGPAPVSGAPRIPSGGGGGVPRGGSSGFGGNHTVSRLESKRKKSMKGGIFPKRKP